MSTEQYSTGYEEGFQNGWNAAVDSLPAQRKPLTDEDKQRIHNETGASHSLICLVENAIEAKLKENT